MDPITERVYLTRIECELLLEEAIRQADKCESLWMDIYSPYHDHNDFKQPYLSWQSIRKKLTLVLEQFPDQGE